MNIHVYHLLVNQNLIQQITTVLESDTSNIVCTGVQHPKTQWITTP